VKRETINYKSIGVIRSDHLIADEVPIQPAYAKGCTGRAEIFPDFVLGLRDLDEFSHVYLIYHLHLANPARLIVRPFLQDMERGLFATRAPCRPNPIGLSVVELVRIDGNILYLDCLDILDGTPLLDIKPYTQRFEPKVNIRNGWLGQINEKKAQGRRFMGTGRPDNL